MGMGVPLEARNRKIDKDKNLDVSFLNVALLNQIRAA